jgi:hypothetical protein
MFFKKCRATEEEEGKEGKQKGVVMWLFVA